MNICILKIKQDTMCNVKLSPDTVSLSSTEHFSVFKLIVLFFSRLSTWFAIPAGVSLIFTLQEAENTP